MRQQDALQARTKARARMILQGEDRTAQRQRGSMTKRRHVGRKETANRRIGKRIRPNDGRAPVGRRSGVGWLRKRDTSDAPERQKTIGIGCGDLTQSAKRRQVDDRPMPVCPRSGTNRHTSDSSRRQRTRFEETLNANRRHVLPPHERRRPRKAKSERQETYLPAAVRNFFKTDHTSYFLILKNGVVKRRFFVIKNNFRPAKAPTHVGLFRIFSPFIFR